MPRRQTNTLFLIFSSCLSIEFILFKFFMPEESALVSVYEYLRLCFFYAAATLAYIISYSAIEADSPTLLITLRIAQAGSGGLLKDDLSGSLGDDCLLIPRLNDLVRDGLATFKENSYALSAKGSLFVGIFIFYRKILGAQKGG